MKRALLSLVLASCTHDIAVFDRVEVQPARDIDILYVFDNSADRGTYDQMASQLGLLRARLEDVDGQVPSLHVGVVTTDLGARGTADVLPAPPVGNCVGDGDAGRLQKFAADLDGNFLEDLRGPDGTRVRNFDSDDFELELSRLTNPGANVAKASSGCEFEQPLEAMRRALDPKTNPGFIRRDALLSIVFLTTEDDCSFQKADLISAQDFSLGPLSSYRCTSQGIVCDEDLDRPGVKTNCRPREGNPLMVDVSEYAELLTSFKRDPRDVIVSAVAGARTPFEVRDLGGLTLLPSCSGPGGPARPAVRIGALVDTFGGVLADGCAQDAVYTQLANPLVTAQRATSCLPNLRRADGEDCIVKEITGAGEAELPRCADGAPSPCWFTYADAAACPVGDNLGITVHRGDTTAPADARIEATCFVQ